MVVGEDDFAGNLGADGLRVVVVEDQPVDVAGKIFHGAGDARGGGKILAPEDRHIHAALVDELVCDLAGLGVGGGFLDAAIEEGIPARRQMVEARAFEAEVAVGRPAALGVILRAHHRVHAAIDDPVELFAEGVAADRRSVADDRREETAGAAGLVGRMLQIGQVEDGHAEELEKRVRRGGLVVVQVDGAGNDSPVGMREAAVGDGAVHDAVAALARLEQHPAGKQQRSRGGKHHRVSHGAHAL